MRQKETSKYEYASSDLLENITSFSNKELKQFLLDNPNQSQETLSIALCNTLPLMNRERTLTLLEAGADPNFQNGSPLIILAKNIDSSENLDLFDLLVEYGCQMDGTNEQNQGFVMAVYEGNIRLVEKMLNQGGINLSFKGSEPLVMAASEGHTDIVDLLIAKDSNQDFEEAFCRACEYGHLPCIDCLIKAVNLDEIKHDALERAAFFDMDESIYHLVDTHNIPVNTHDNSFVFTAISSENKKLADYTISKLDKPLAVVQDPDIMGYVQLHKPELVTKISDSLKNNIQNNRNKENEPKPLGKEQNYIR